MSSDDTWIIRYAHNWYNIVYNICLIEINFRHSTPRKSKLSIYRGLLPTKLKNRIYFESSLRVKKRKFSNEMLYRLNENNYIRTVEVIYWRPIPTLNEVFDVSSIFIHMWSCEIVNIRRFAEMKNAIFEQNSKSFEQNYFSRFVEVILYRRLIPIFRKGSISSLYQHRFHNFVNRFPSQVSLQVQCFYNSLH